MPDGTNPKEDGEVDGLLAKALSGPPADPVFRARLRQHILAVHTAERLAGTGSRTSRHAATRGRVPALRRPVAVLALVAVAALAVVVARPVLFPSPPAAEFGALPQPAVKPDSGQGGAGGPGYTFDFSYSLGGGLATAWPKLPGRELAYRMNAAPFTDQHVAELASKLGINAPVVHEGWHEGYLLAADPGNGGPFVRMFPDGYTIYMRPYDFSPASRAELPSDARALEIARSWLQSSGFAPASSLGTGTVEFDEENGTLFVRFRPATPVPVVGVSPFANVQIGRGELVVMGGVTWFTVNANSEYRLRPVREAWEDVKNGKGLLDFQAREYPGPAGDDNVVKGQATAEHVRLAWALAWGPDGTAYLVPVYAFAGNVTVEGAEGPVVLLFEVWAPAVTEEYVQR